MQPFTYGASDMDPDDMDFQDHLGALAEQRQIANEQDPQDSRADTLAVSQPPFSNGQANIPAPSRPQLNDEQAESLAALQRHVINELDLEALRVFCNLLGLQQLDENQGAVREYHERLFLNHSAQARLHLDERADTAFYEPDLPGDDNGSDSGDGYENDSDDEFFDEDGNLIEDDDELPPEAWGDPEYVDMPTREEQDAIDGYVERDGGEAADLMEAIRNPAPPYSPEASEGEVGWLNHTPEEHRDGDDSDDDESDAVEQNVSDQEEAEEEDFDDGDSLVFVMSHDDEDFGSTDSFIPRSAVDGRVNMPAAHSLVIEDELTSDNSSTMSGQCPRQPSYEESQEGQPPDYYTSEYENELDWGEYLRAVTDDSEPARDDQSEYGVFGAPDFVTTSSRNSAAPALPVITAMPVHTGPRHMTPLEALERQIEDEGRGFYRWLRNRMAARRGEPLFSPLSPAREAVAPLLEESTPLRAAPRDAEESNPLNPFTRGRRRRAAERAGLSLAGITSHDVDGAGRYWRSREERSASHRHEDEDDSGPSSQRNSSEIERGSGSFHRVQFVQPPASEIVDGEEWVDADDAAGQAREPIATSAQSSVTSRIFHSDAQRAGRHPPPYDYLQRRTLSSWNPRYADDMHRASATRRFFRRLGRNTSQFLRDARRHRSSRSSDQDKRRSR